MRIIPFLFFCLSLVAIATACSDDFDEVQPDPSPPVVEITSGPPELTGESSAQFEFQCLGDTHCDFACSLDGDDTTPCTPPQAYDGLADGERAFVVVATDDEGAESEPASWHWTVDTSPPIIDITDAPPAQTEQTTATIAFECTNKPSCAFECAVDHVDPSAGLTGGDHQSCTSPHQLDDLAIGEYQFHIRATDELGNQSQKDTAWEVIRPTLGAMSTSSGGLHTCAVTSDNTLWCWGSDYAGRLGLGERTHSTIPRQVGDDADWTTVDAGLNHTCGIREDQSLWCWGSNTYGQLGLGDPEDTPEHRTPVQVGSDTDWRALSSGRLHVCGLRDDDSLWCWGRNDGGQLGLDDEENRFSPQPVPGDDDWQSVMAIFDHTCGIRDDSTLWCWGKGWGGRLGLGDTDNRTTPVPVGSDDDWEMVAGGNAHTCGIRDDSTLWCWGFGEAGRLGQDSTEDHLSPQRVGDDADWQTVFGGLRHMCAIRQDSTLWCWGDNAYAKLGTGDYDERRLPEQIGEDADWAAGTAGHDHSCGIRHDSTLWCWGTGYSGQLGQDDNTTSTTPEEVIASWNDD